MILMDKIFLIATGKKIQEFDYEFDECVEITQAEIERLKKLVENSIETLRAWIEEPFEESDIEKLEKHMVEDKSLLKKHEPR